MKNKATIKAKASINHDICQFVRQSIGTKDGEVNVIDKLVSDCLTAIDNKKLKSSKKIALAVHALKNIRNAASNGRLVGAFTAKKVDDIVYIGWSKCSSLDRFNKKSAITLANRRIESKSTRALPPSLAKGYAKFKERCSRYYDAIPIKELEVASYKTENV